MVNLSFIDGIFNDPFKHTIVMPLIKKPSLSKDDLKNYRPVSGFISKVVQCVAVSQLKSHLPANNLDNMNQSAYKAGHSSETALVKNQKCHFS